MGRKKGGGAGGAGGGAAPGTGGAAREKGLEVEDGADGRAPSVSGREGERGALVGRCGFVGRKRSWAARAGKKGREGERVWRVFFSNSFQIFFKPFFLNSNLLHLFKFKF
jgi:hypothetical protein